ncbi:hypothetical protein Ahy_B06g079898 [Arachis hypogaea]|uniref:RING-type E3 ubiquitin transferase n=1 Tax=Arachis hypogaea TaxID=3818 RepID=A0A444YGK3_ARAHY|nr:hypothetical protein Ahy_B06g079898 [Arachis hypogaea]
MGLGHFGRNGSGEAGPSGTIPPTSGCSAGDDARRREERATKSFWGQMLYYVLTTGSGQQTLGEEYCDTTQFAESYGESAIRSRSSQDSAVSPSTSGQNSTTLSRLKQKLSGFWLHVVQQWLVVILLLDRLIEVIKFPEVTSVHAFHFLPFFAGLYYHISKHAAGIRYLFIGKPSNQRPSCGRAVPKKFIFSCSVHQASFASQQRSAGHGLPVLNEEGNLASLDTDEGGWVYDSSSSENGAKKSQNVLFAAPQ